MLLKLTRYIDTLFLFFVLAAGFGLLYALQLIGIATDTIRPDLTRSLHITLMLYGFPTAVMTLLPFALFEKDGVLNEASVRYLRMFLSFWILFVVFTIFSLRYGATRGLPFYDFPYELNFLLAFAGMFYILALVQSVKGYVVKPLWVKVSLWVVLVSPVALLILMNPQFGQVEKTLHGPHGDNTLGMSFALMVIYYLTIKLVSNYDGFRPRWHILWIIPLVGYMASVFYRSFVGTLSYNQEWFLQYLTLLYLPLLYRWWKDAKLSYTIHTALFLSILAFVFADIEGNILFIPQIRELFHRNDLVIGHAHIAVGIGYLFLTFAVVSSFWKVGKRWLYYFAGMLILMAIVLTVSGFEQAGFAQSHTQTHWQMRALIGALFWIGTILFMAYRLIFYAMTRFQNDILMCYHLIGFLSDGIGGAMLVLFGPTLYAMIGQSFIPGYEQIVFGFVLGVGVIHLSALLFPAQAATAAWHTVPLRAFTAAGFFALYKTGTIGAVALLISIVDLLFVAFYLIYFHKEQ